MCKTCDDKQDANILNENLKDHSRQNSLKSRQKQRHSEMGKPQKKQLVGTH